jgi:hypothetical protein
MSPENWPHGLFTPQETVMGEPQNKKKEAITLN